MKHRLKSSTSMKTTAGIIYDNYIDEQATYEIKHKMEFVDGEENSGFQLIMLVIGKKDVLTIALLYYLFVVWQVAQQN